MLWEFDALWEYKPVANAVPANPFAVTVPDAGWSGPASAPFGTLGISTITNLPATSAWALGTGLWIRRAIVADGLSGVLLTGQVRNSCLVYVDGVLIGTVNRENAVAGDLIDLQVVIPKDWLPEGVHELALLCLDAAGGVSDTTFVWVAAEVEPSVLPLWPSKGLVEVAEWMTDVTVYENGEEGREQLRNAPRHQYRMDFFVPPPARQSISNALYGARAGQWIVPIWSQAQPLGAVDPGQLTLDALTSFSEFRPGGLLVLWESPQSWQVIGVDKVPDANTITLSGPTGGFTDAWLAPAHKGFFQSDPKRAFDGRNSRVSLTFNAEDNAALTVADPPQYLGNDIYFDPSLMEGDATSEAVTTSFYLMDEDTGLVAYRSPWVHNRPARSHGMMAEGPEAAWAVRQWLHRRRGRFVPFWQPSFEIDLRVASVGPVNSVLLVQSDDYLRYASARSHVAVETTAGWVAGAITLAEQVSPTQVQLTLDIDLAVDASAILRVCFLSLRRLDSDRAEINWIGGQVCTCTVPVLDIAP